MVLQRIRTEQSSTHSVPPPLVEYKIVPSCIHMSLKESLYMAPTNPNKKNITKGCMGPFN
jgi:hypothetical protein